jgi:hypothetical protein
VVFRIEAVERRRIALGGATAGLSAGVAVSVFLYIGTSIVGTNPWVCLKIAALPLIGPTALRPWFEVVPVIVGQLAHLAVSAAWGIVFAALVIGTRPIVVVAAGLVWGLVVRAAMVGYVLPALGLTMLARSLPGALLRPWHLIFGAVLGIAFAIVQRRRVRTGPLRGFLPAWLSTDTPVSRPGAA